MTVISRNHGLYNNIGTNLYDSVTDIDSRNKHDNFVRYGLDRLFTEHKQGVSVLGDHS